MNLFYIQLRGFCLQPIFGLNTVRAYPVPNRNLRRFLGSLNSGSKEVERHKDDLVFRQKLYEAPLSQLSFGKLSAFGVVVEVIGGKASLRWKEHYRLTDPWSLDYLKLFDLRILVECPQKELFSYLSNLRSDTQFGIVNELKRV